MSYKVCLPGRKPFYLSTEELGEHNINSIGDLSYHLITKGRSYHCKIESIDLCKKEVEISVNGRKQVVIINDELDQRVASMALNSKGKAQNKNLISSMPGQVLNISVEEDQQIQEGDTLMILEAMKMENVLKAGSAGVVKRICCSEKDAVDKGQLLIEIE